MRLERDYTKDRSSSDISKRCSFGSVCDGIRVLRRSAYFNVSNRLWVSPQSAMMRRMIAEPGGIRPILHTFFYFFLALVLFWCFCGVAASNDGTSARGDARARRDQQTRL